MQYTWKSTKKNKKKNKNKNKKKSKLSLSSTSVNKANSVNGNRVNRLPGHGIHHYGMHLDSMQSLIGTMSPAAKSLVSLNILMENNSDCDSEDEEDNKE
jgi:hypothetical protein